MVKLNEVYPSRFLAADDLENKEHHLMITHVAMEEVGQKKDSRPVLYYRSKTLPNKGIILNKTNFQKIATLYGDDSDDWTGKYITAFVAMVEFQGDTTPAIRLKAPPKNFKPAEPQASKQAEDMDEEIPF